MHISEGILSPAVIAGGMALTALGTGAGLKKADYPRLATAATMASVVFVGSLVHIPLGPGSAHLVLNGIAGLFLGWTVFPAFLVALLLQAVLLGFGGMAVLGVNVLSLALPAVLCHYLFRRRILRPGAAGTVAAFCCGALPVAGAAGCAVLALTLADDAFRGAAQLILLAHIPVMVLEGIITASVVGFVAKCRPELLPAADSSVPGRFS